MKSEWKDITGYEGLYAACTDGRIKSYATSHPNLLTGTKSIRKGRILKQGKTKCGYNTVVLCGVGNKKTKLVHRLIAQTFLPNPSNLPQVNHINPIKTNNKVENLEWCSCSDNIRHSYSLGIHTTNLPTYPKGNNHFNCKEVVRLAPSGEKKVYQSINDAIVDCDAKSGSGISNVLSGRAKTAHGYKWNYTT